MPVNLAQRGAGALRHLHLLSRPTRVATIHTHARRVILPTNGRLLKPIARGIHPSGARYGLINSYATAAKGATKDTKTKTARKTTPTKTTNKPKSAAKGTKRTTKKAPKPAAKPKKKVLTEKQKEAKVAKDQREKIKELKEAALTPPKRLPDRAWTLSLQSKLTEAAKTHQKGKESFKAAADMAKTISEEERERFAVQAEANRAANKAAYVTWIQSHTPLQIKEANQARRRLAKIKDTSVSLLDDDRLVKRPRTSYLLFLTERSGDGDFKHMDAKDVVVRVAEEWNGLTDAEKEKYKMLQAADRERYNREYKETYGEEPRA